MNEAEGYRIFVGGLAPGIQKEEIREKFQSFGSASEVYLVEKKNKEGEVLKTFGYLNLKTTEQKLNRCFTVFGGTKWKGYDLKIQLAKDDFMKRLRKEWDNPEPVKVSQSRKRKQVGPVKKYEELVSKCQNLKKMLPGVPIEGEKNWVIGKYGRPLPVIHIGRIPGRRAIKHDPSKHCHCIKKIPDYDSENGRRTYKKLTWEMDEIKHLQDDVKPMKKKKKVTTSNIEPEEKTIIETKKEPKEKPISSKTEKKSKLERDVAMDFEIVPQAEIKGSRVINQNNEASDSEPDFEIVPQKEIKGSIVINSRFDSSESESSDVETEPAVKITAKSSKSDKPIEIKSQTKTKSKAKKITKSASPDIEMKSQVKVNSSQNNKPVKDEEMKETDEIQEEVHLKEIDREKEIKLKEDKVDVKSEELDGKKKDQADEDIEKPKEDKQTSSSSSAVEEIEDAEPDKIVEEIKEVEPTEFIQEEESEEDEDIDDENLPTGTPVVSTTLKRTPGGRALSDSIVKQLQSSKKNTCPTTPAELKMLKFVDDDDNDESESDDNKDGGKKASMFDFNFDKIKSQIKGVVNEERKDNENEAHQSESDYEDENEDEGEQEINLFDFEFENLKEKSGIGFLKTMDLRWQDEKDGSSSSDGDSSDSEVDEPSPKKKKTQNAMTEDTVITENVDEEDEEIKIFDFEFENLKQKRDIGFLKTMDLRWQDEKNGSSSSDDDSIDSEVDEASPPKDGSTSSEDDSIDSEVDKASPAQKKKTQNNVTKDTVITEIVDADKANHSTNTKSSVGLADKFEQRFGDLSSESEDESMEVEEKVSLPPAKQSNAEKDGICATEEAVNALIEVDTLATKKKKKKVKSTVAENSASVEIKEDTETSQAEKKEKRRKKDKKAKDEKDSKHHTPGMSEAARLKSLEAFNQRTQKNKDFIKNALRGLDTNQPSANRIRFDDDDEDDEIEAVADVIGNQDDVVVADVNVKKSGSSLWDESASDEEEDTKEKTKHKEGVVDFFGDEEDVDESDRFSVKPQFQGKQGGKLFKMQLHYGGDERFRLDERFANDGDEEGNDDGENVTFDQESQVNRDVEMEEEKDGDSDDLEGEKERNLALLENILGKPLKRNKKNNFVKPYDRYDPTKTDHANFEVQQEEKKPKKSKNQQHNDDDDDNSDDSDDDVVQKDVKATEEVTPEEILPEVSKERFYEVDTSLKSLFNTASNEDKSGGSSFTFLSAQNDEPTNDDTESDHVMEAKPIKEVSWMKGLDENEDVTMVAEEEEKDGDSKKEEKKLSGFFFFEDNDDRLDKGSAFKRTGEMDDIRKQWDNTRQVLHDDFKKKHKDAVRRVRKMKEKAGSMKKT